MKQTRWLSEFSSLSEYTRLYPIDEMEKFYQLHALRNKASKPASDVVPSFKWCFAGGSRLLVVFGSSFPSSTKT